MEIAVFEDVDFAAVYADLGGTSGGRRPYTVVNMVSSLDGRVSVAGVSGKLGSAIDHRVMRKIRSVCDALVEGAGTLRAENVDPRVPEEMVAGRRARGQSALPLRVVISSMGNVPLDNLFLRVPGDPAVMFVSSRADVSSLEKHADKVRVVVAGAEVVDLIQATAVLARDFGIRTMLVEGGPVLTYALLREHLVDELFLTLAPKIVGGEHAKTIVDGPELPTPCPLTLLSVYRHESELFLRYKINR